MVELHAGHVSRAASPLAGRIPALHREDEEYRGMEMNLLEDIIPILEKLGVNESD